MSLGMADVTVFYEATPNPQSMKFVLTAQIANENVNFTKPEETTRSPLARKLFGFPWAAGIFIGPNFVTVTKQEWVEWEILADPLAELIKEHVLSGEPVLVAAEVGQESTANDDEPNDSPIIRQIKQILREEIRPAVAMDGGDISFVKYEAGCVYLEMKGACSGCPSSMITLKEGIEVRLKDRIPEIKEVFSI